VQTESEMVKPDDVKAGRKSFLVASATELYISKHCLSMLIKLPQAE